MLDCVVQRAEVEEGNRISCSRNFPYTLTCNADKHVGWNYHLRLSDEVTGMQFANPAQGPANKECTDRGHSIFEGLGKALKWQEKGWDHFCTLSGVRHLLLFHWFCKHEPLCSAEELAVAARFNPLFLSSSWEPIIRWDVDPTEAAQGHPAHTRPTLGPAPQRSWAYLGSRLMGREWYYLHC